MSSAAAAAPPAGANMANPNVSQQEKLAEFNQKIYEIPPPASSLYLQVFITFEMYYSIFYVVFLFAIEFYKGKSLFF